MKKHILFLLVIIFTLHQSVWAQSSFVVRKIEFDGLQGISPATAYSYVHIKTGQVLTPKKAQDTIRDLYHTGFFDRVYLERRVDVLVIHVTERLIIGQLKVTGNSLIPTDKLTTVMKTMDIQEGSPYNPALIDRIKQALLSQYYMAGHYNARVDVFTTPMSRSRVIVRIDISEGVSAKIRSINIIGNHVFSDKEITSAMSDSFTTPGLLTFITQKDRYSEERLEEGLGKLHDFYLDHGYLKFRVVSARGEITPDRKSVYITANVEEGPQYKVKGYALTGQFVVPKEELDKLIQVKAGDIFSRQKVVDSEKAISDKLGDNAYIFALVTVDPKIDEVRHEVFLTFIVKPGRRAYVHHILFTENTRTNDEVLRREVEQLEAAPISTKKLDASKQRLRLLTYIKDVDMSITPVPGKKDQVDVNYKVKEDSSAQATFTVGYSQLYHFILGAGLVQKNFMGTGKTVGINFNKSAIQSYYGLDYTDPYYTADGISRSFNLSVSRFNPNKASGLTNYYSDEYDAGVLYGIPLGQEVGAFNRVQLGLGYQETVLHLAGNPATQAVNYINQHGRHYQELDFKAGITRDTRDKAIFPTSGGQQNFFADFFAPLSSKSISYYTLNYHGKWYHPLTEQFIGTARMDLGYGAGLHGAKNFPFFKNFFAGGIDSVRGYDDYTLGPQDSNRHAFGGNVLVDGSLGIIFPNFISENLRTTAFFDAGNVYNTFNNGTTAAGPIRYSVGVEGDWLTPVGSIGISLAKALNLHHQDSGRIFQFTLGASLG